MERNALVVVPAIDAIERITECRIYAGVEPGINIDHRVHVSNRHDAGVLERNAEVEDVGMRVKQIVRGIDHLRTFQGHVLAHFYIHAARREPGRVEERMGLDDVELSPTVDRFVELAEEMGVARVRSEHRLELEAEIVTGRLRVERALDRQHRLVQQGLIGLIRKEMAEVYAVGRIGTIERDTCLDMTGYRQRIPPGRCRRWRLLWHLE